MTNSSNTAYVSPTANFAAKAACVAMQLSVGIGKETALHQATA